MNKFEILLEKVDSINTIEEIKKIEEEIAEEFSQMLEYKKKEEEKKKAKEEKKKAQDNSKSNNDASVYKNITALRYGVMNLYSELGLTHDKTYTKNELITILNNHGYFEFNTKNTEFAQHPTDGTVVIIIRGSSKGNIKIPYSLLSIVENYFKLEYEKKHTEARALVYYNETDSKYLIISPKQKNTVVSTTSDVQFNISRSGKEYYLFMDLHSHHIMGSSFSIQDDENEKFRNIIFGVFSWQSKIDIWRFRIFNGSVFKYLKYDEVVIK